jgi:hypothetical protein
LARFRLTYKSLDGCAEGNCQAKRSEELCNRHVLVVHKIARLELLLHKAKPHA